MKYSLVNYFLLNYYKFNWWTQDKVLLPQWWYVISYKGYSAYAYKYMGEGRGADLNLNKSLLVKVWAIIWDSLVKGDENIQNLRVEGCKNIIKMQEVPP